jgi:hypothetical protein
MLQLPTLFKSSVPKLTEKRRRVPQVSAAERHAGNCSCHMRHACVHRVAIWLFHSLRLRLRHRPPSAVATDVIGCLHSAQLSHRPPSARGSQPRYDWYWPRPRDLKGSPEVRSRETDFSAVSTEPSWRGATRELACSWAHTHGKSLGYWLHFASPIDLIHTPTASALSPFSAFSATWALLYFPRLFSPLESIITAAECGGEGGEEKWILR